MSDYVEKAMRFIHEQTEKAIREWFERTQGADWTAEFESNLKELVSLRARLEAAEAERDEARREAERLREALIRMVAAIDWSWQDASRYFIGEDTAEAALATLGFDWNLGVCNEAVGTFARAALDGVKESK